MRTLRLGALAVLCLVAPPGAAAIPPPTETDVSLHGLSRVEDGTGVVTVRTAVVGDVAQCEGTLRLRVIDRSEGEKVLDASKPMAERRRFRVDLEPGRYRVVGDYEVGERDGCAKSRDVRKLRVSG